MARSQLRYPNSQYFGFQNPLNNPNLMTYFADGYQVAGLGNLPPSAAQPGAGPSTNKTGMDYDVEEPGIQGSADPIPLEVEEFEETEDTTEKTPDPVSSKTPEQTTQEMFDKFMELMRYNDDPQRLAEKFAITEPIYERRAQLNQKMGLENLEAAGKASFKYKTGPQMYMTAAASRAAYYPEMVRAASESFTGLNLANAAKPRMSGYYRGIV